MSEFLFAFIALMLLVGH